MLGRLFGAQNSATTWWIQSALAGNTVGSGGGAFGISQGTDVFNRVGDKIRLSKIEFQITVAPIPGSVATSGSWCRMIIYHNKACNGAVTAPTALFDTDTATSMRNELLRPRLSLLRDQLHVMTPTSSASSVPVTSSGNLTMKWTIYPKKVIKYAHNASTLAAIVADDYGFGFVSNNAGCCAVTCEAKVFFTDP